MSSALAATTVKVVDDSSGPMEIVDALLDGPRRSLRKRGETTSYAESPDMMIIEEDGSARSAGGNSGNGSGGGGDIRPPPSKKHPQANGAVSEEDPERRTRCKDLRQRMEKIAPPGKTQEEEEEEESDDDDDDTIQEIPLPKDVPPSLLAEREATIKKLQTRLRNEEMSLVLLKKIQQSQVLAAAAVSAAASSSAAASKAINPAAVANNSNSSHGHGTPSTGAGKQQPSISYIGGGATITPATSSKATSKQHHHQPHHRSHQHPNHNLEPKTQISTDIQQLKSMDNKGQLPGSLPPNLINLMTNSGLSAKPKSKPEVNETPQQRQAAAKLALRKQLEKTLLQIPPPKPPPPEMHFIPNPTNSEFICLLGLEECVSKILMGNKENNATSSLTQPSHHHQLLPFSCSQCNTDFTPTWKWDKAAKGKEVKVICENCVTTNVKKALKAEHTNRLKSAFVKALQQEQELEAHMAQEASLAAAAATAAAAASTSSSVTLSRSPRVSSPAASESTRRGLTVSPSTTRSPRGGGGGAAFSSSFCAPPPPAVSITQQSSSSSGRPSRGRGRPESNRNNHVGAKNNSLPNNTNSSNNAANALGYDLASMSALQAAATQQLLLAGGNGRGGNHPGSSSASSSSAGRGDTHQMTTAALGQHLMNPLLYNYQALALQAAMQAAAMGNNNANSNVSNNINSSGGRYNSAANQMLELQQQIQRQYLLDMIPPGSLAQSWGGGSAKK